MMSENSTCQTASFSARERRSSNEPRDNFSRVRASADYLDTESSQRFERGSNRSVDSDFIKIVKKNESKLCILINGIEFNGSSPEDKESRGAS